MRLFEKYRPNSFDDIWGQDEIIYKIKNILSRGVDNIPHMLFLGGPGVGKTTTAICIARQLFGDDWRKYFFELNASDKRKIDDIRNIVKRLAKIKGHRIIFLDESDSLTNDAQQALRRIMEKTRGTIFILSGNKEYKIIDPIKSRCSVFRFKKLDNKTILRKILDICKKEGIKIKPEAKEGLLCLVENSRGDLRAAINTLETLVNEEKEITEKEVISLRKPDMVKESLELAISGNFEKAKEILEDCFLVNGGDNMIDDFYEAISSLEDREVKIRLYQKIADVERACKIGANPLIQFVGFIAYAWVVPHLPKECPLRGGDGS